MPTISDFASRFGWNELLITFLIVLIIVGSHEWKNVLGLFIDVGEKKKESTHSEE